MNIIELTQNYLEKNDIDMSIEEMYVQFQLIVECHEEFDQYLKENNLNETLEKMKRSKRLLQKRKLFTQWYILKFQNKKFMKEIHIDLSEIVFASERTVREDIISLETTA